MRNVPWICVVSFATLVGADFAHAGDRVRRLPPTPEEEARIASETAMNDGLLQKGDIVVTDRGFFVFRGVGEDGYTYDFAPIENPLTAGRSAPPADERNVRRRVPSRP